jgi:sec-independent protein translocase protein TatB
VGLHKEGGRVFSNLHWTNIVVILLLALFIFGDKLPNMIVDGLRMLRKLRQMAQSATTDLSRELGTEITLEDLHPKTFIRKHVLSEEDQAALLQPLKNLETDFKDVGEEAKDVVGEMNGRSSAGKRATRTGKSRPVAEQPAAPPTEGVAAEAPAASYEDLP